MKKLNVLFVLITLGMIACSADSARVLMDGRDGIDGAPGANGVDGLDGEDGLNGTNGIDGEDGTPGVDGTDGLNAVINVTRLDGSDPRCSNGGVLIEVGMDDDGDGLLEHFVAAVEGVEGRAEYYGPPMVTCTAAGVPHQGCGAVGDLVATYYPAIEPVQAVEGQAEEVDDSEVVCDGVPQADAGVPQ